ISATTLLCSHRQRSHFYCLSFFFTYKTTTKIYTLSLHDALPISVFALMIGAMFPIIHLGRPWLFFWLMPYPSERQIWTAQVDDRSEEHTSELQSRGHLVCRLLLEKKKI